MRTQAASVIRRILFLVFSLAVIGSVALHAQDSWTNIASGKWEVGANWSAGAPNAAENVFITNLPNGKTVTIDATTSGSFSNTLTIEALTLGGESDKMTNILVLNNAGLTVPLLMQGRLTLGSTGAGYMFVTNSSVVVEGVATLDEGILTLTGSSFIATNQTFDVGRTGHATFTVNSGTTMFSGVALGGPNGNTWTINGGTNLIQNSAIIANGAFAMNGGKLFATNSGTGLFILGNNTTSLATAAITNGEVHTVSTEVTDFGTNTLLMQGGLLTATSNMVICVNPGTSGSALITGGTVAVTNAVGNAYLDIRGGGSLTLDGGLLQVDSLLLTNGGVFTNIAGTLQYLGPFLVDNGSSIAVAGGVLNAGTNLTIGSVSGSTGTVNVTGGSLIVTNAPLMIGPAGMGTLTLFSNASLTAQTIYVGSAAPGASGTLQVNGGSARVTSLLSVNSTNSVDFSPEGHNITFDGTGASLNVGDDNPGAVRIDGSGTVNFASINVGLGSAGTYEQSGMQVFVNNQMTIGTCVTNGVEIEGTVTLSGGTLYVTNSTHSAALVVRNGTFLLENGGTLVADYLIITNACAEFQNLGGTLTVNPANIILSPTLDADGDGVSNAAEQAAGTDPLNPSSYFHITGVTRSGNDAIITWAGVPGRNYFVQACTNPIPAKSGNYLNVSPQVPANVPGTTSYRVPGGATNRFVLYRIMLAQ